jgi:2-dehydropantoate 2-reductase
MRILLFGAGAMGTYIGGSLALAGHTVTFIERPEAADIIQAKGLKLKLGEVENKVLPAKLVTSAAEALAAGPYDFGVFALKSFDTASALDQLRSASAPIPPLLCFQNGVDNEPEIAQALGADHVIAGTVTTAIGKPGVGEIVLERKRGVGVALGHPLSQEIVTALASAGLGARAYPAAGPM